MELEIYDPRRGQRFEVKNLLTKKSFSNLPHELFVVSGVGIDWGNCIPLLQEAVAKTSTLGFVAVKPWIPHCANVIRSMEAAFPSSMMFEKSLIGYFQPNATTMERILALRLEHGGDESGEWSLGGCLSEFKPPERLSVSRASAWDFAHLLGQAHNIGLALELAEMQQTTLMTKVFTGFDDWWNRMRVSLLNLNRAAETRRAQSSH